MSRNDSATRADAAVIGIDLGGTKALAAIADPSGRILLESTTPTDASNARALVDQLVDVSRRLHGATGAELPLGTVVVAGAGSPDPVDGRLQLAPNLGGVEQLDLQAELAAALSCEIVLENDVNAAAVGELVSGEGRSTDDFVFIAIGTGIGMGIVHRGRLVRGAHGQAGEIGFLPFGTDALDPANHAKGPLEEAASGPSIAAAYRRRAGVAATSAEVFALAHGGDAVAQEVVDHLARDVARGIVAVQAVLDPGAFVLGGGIGSRPDLLDPIRRWCAAFGKPALAISQSILGERAGLIGALHLALSAPSSR